MQISSFFLLWVLFILNWPVLANNVMAQEEQLLNEQPSEEIAKERADVPDAPFLSLNGVRYEAIHWGRAIGLDQNGGYIAVRDEKTGRQKRLVRIYVIHYKKDMETDKQDVFILRLTWGSDKRSLWIENEKGQHYSLDIRNFSVKGPFSKSMN
jgi:hypothetical protein